MKIALTIMAVTGIAIGLAIPAKPRAAAAPVAQPVGDVPVETVLDRTPNGHFLAVADVNDEPIRFVVDTGADTVALTVEDARRAHVAFDPLQFQVVGRGASGDVRGQEVRIANIVLDGKRATDVRAVVLEGSDMSLLGHSYLRRMQNVQIAGDKMTLR
ncbi:TIGR02281 family clan AA aspartic protease [Sphingomonas sp. So64.6b]|uniref:retropepsin-like aspartic protease family protein n=1 Tax=Sphingomonas sp. So64.6b TaxID=2997354 RepID=UPI0015FEC354|nr:TIGR02281 family clan AA aspartic protease [Sphingomonas sp. So64.6b]QNA86023.1 TIGR02281 family clan AA aspartic protease [Sphingomonas sp. So64.6b]